MYWLIETIPRRFMPRGDRPGRKLSDADLERLPEILAEIKQQKQ